MLRTIDQIRSLNDLPRTGWVKRGIPLEEAETVGEHTAECVVMAGALAKRVGVCRERLMEMLAIHDWPESDPLVGDITLYCGVSRQEKFDREYDAMVRLCQRLRHGETFLELWLAFEACATPEARIANQLDKLQMVYRALGYQMERGFDPTEFIDDCEWRIEHPVLRRIFEQLKKAAESE